MPRKTLALIAGLVLVTVILFIIALKTGQNQPSAGKEQAAAPTAVPDMAHSVLSMSPDPVVVAPGGQGSVDVMVDPSDNLLTGVQLELSYDPKVISNIKVAYGSLFVNPLVLFHKGDAVKGTYTYGFGIQPGQKPVAGKGTVATITFTATGAVGTQSQLTLLPTSLVTARGTATSVLKMSSGTTVKIGIPTAGAAKPVTSTAPTKY